MYRNKDIKLGKTPNSMMVDRAKFSYLLSNGPRMFMNITFKEHLQNISNVLYRHGFGHDFELMSSVWVYNSSIEKSEICRSFTDRVLNVQIDTNSPIHEFRNKDAILVSIAERIAHFEYILSEGDKKSFINLKYFYDNIFKPKILKIKEHDKLWEELDQITDKTWESHVCI